MLATAIQFEREAEWERAAKRLDLDPTVARELLHPQLECTSRHTCEEVGSPATLYIAAAETSLRASLAKLEIGEHVQADEIRASAQRLRLEAGIAGTDLTAAAIGVRLPSQISEHALWELARATAPVVQRVLGEASLLPDDPRAAAFAAWMGLGPAIAAEKYCERLSTFLAEVMQDAVRLALDQQGKPMRGTQAVVLGLTPVLCAAILRLSEAGVRIIGVADESGAVHDDAGLDLPFLLDHTHGGGLVAEFAGGEHVVHTDLINLPSDLLLLDAGDPEITEANAQKVKAPLLIEGPTSRLTESVCEVLEEQGTTVVPNWMMDSVRLLPEIPADLRLTHRALGATKEHLAQTWEELLRVQKSQKVPLRSAALFLALERLAERAAALRP